MWEWACPCCNTEFESECTIDYIKEHIGATHNCPKCGALLIIEENCTCKDFGAELVQRYSSIGMIVSKKGIIDLHIRV